MSNNQHNEQKPSLNADELRGFTGTENWYRHGLFSRYLYTDGVQYVAEKGGAYWLLDKIFACQSCVPTLSDQGFIVWELTRDENGEGAKLLCTDGNENALYEERISFTDFPLQSIKFYFIDNILLLPSEY